MIQHMMPLTASRVVVENAPDRLVIREDRWGGHTVADLGEYTAETHALGALFAAAQDMYEALEACASMLSEIADTEDTPWFNEGGTLATIKSAQAALAKVEGR